MTDEAQLRRQLEALFELADLPEHFPLLRPVSPAFDAWADALGTVDDPGRELIDEGLAFLGEDELERIVSGHAAAFPAVWRQLCEEAGDELLAQEAVLEGAIVAALREERRLDPQILELVEKVRGIAADHAEALALALEGTDLWSVAEAVSVDDALASAPRSASTRTAGSSCSKPRSPGSPHRCTSAAWRALSGESGRSCPPRSSRVRRGRSPAPAPSSTASPPSAGAWRRCFSPTRSALCGPSCLGSQRSVLRA